MSAWLESYTPLAERIAIKSQLWFVRQPMYLYLKHADMDVRAPSDNMEENVSNFQTPVPMTKELYEYLLSVSLREPEILRQLREETSHHPRRVMQIAPEQGSLLTLLIQLLGAKKTLEVGVFTGYSSLCTALALPADGKLIACDVSEEFTSIARRYWEAAGVAHKIDLRLAPALETLDKLIANGGSGTFDFAFIDADKSNYDGYYERALQLIRPGGIIAFDNVLWDGRVIDPQAQDADTVAIRALNAKLQKDERVTICMLPMADGVTLALKR